MPKQLKILVESEGFIDSLGMNGPVMVPTLVSLNSLINIVNEGHKVKVVTPSGVNVDVDEKYVKKMVKRGDKGVDEVWNKIQNQSKVKPPKIEVNTSKEKSSVTKTKIPDDIDEDKGEKKNNDKKPYTTTKKNKYKKPSSESFTDKKDEEVKKDK
ncbi:MAG: hypothetical protein ACOCRK_05675 [bacterium]